MMVGSEKGTDDAVLIGTYEVLREDMIVVTMSSEETGMDQFSLALTNVKVTNDRFSCDFAGGQIDLHRVETGPNAYSSGSVPAGLLVVGLLVLVLVVMGVAIYFGRAHGIRRKAQVGVFAGQLPAQAYGGPVTDLLPYCTERGAQQLLPDARFSHRCGQPIVPPA
jgi:hypothetical protein